jgi:hypothetical protein
LTNFTYSDYAIIGGLSLFLLGIIYYSLTGSFPGLSYLNSYLDEGEPIDNLQDCVDSLQPKKPSKMYHFSSDELNPLPPKLLIIEIPKGDPMSSFHPKTGDFNPLPEIIRDEPMDLSKDSKVEIHRDEPMSSYTPKTGEIAPRSG